VDQLTNAFVTKCEILEQTISKFIPSGTIRHDVQNFVLEKYQLIRHMTEEEFMTYMRNEDLNSPLYGNFVR
jgi:hypothetical protein